MLFTDLSTVLLLAAAVIAVFLSSGAIYIAAKARQYANDCVLWVQQSNKRSVSLAKLAELETQLTELTDSYSALMGSHRKLRSRISMREKRARDASNGLDLEATQDKAALRAELRRTGQLR